MMEKYHVIAGRIRKELADMQTVVERAGRAITLARQSTEDQDLFLNSTALSLHDFYSGVERLFVMIASNIDSITPRGDRWHLEAIANSK